MQGMSVLKIENTIIHISTRRNTYYWIEYDCGFRIFKYQIFAAKNSMENGSKIISDKVDYFWSHFGS